MGLSGAGGRPRPLRHVRRQQCVHACTRVLAGCRNTRSGGQRLASHTAIKAGILSSKAHHFICLVLRSGSQLPSILPLLPPPPASAGISYGIWSSAFQRSCRESSHGGPAGGPRSRLCRYADVVAQLGEQTPHHSPFCPESGRPLLRWSSNKVLATRPLWCCDALCD